MAFMTLIKVVEVVAAIIALALGLAFLWAGVFELTRGQRPPGILGAQLVLRGGTSRDWSTGRWRHNGFQVIPIGIGFCLVALWIVVKLVIGT